MPEEEFEDEDSVITAIDTIEEVVLLFDRLHSMFYNIFFNVNN